MKAVVKAGDLKDAIDVVVSAANRKSSYTPHAYITFAAVDGALWLSAVSERYGVYTDVKRSTASGEDYFALHVDTVKKVLRGISNDAITIESDGVGVSISADSGVKVQVYTDESGTFKHVKHDATHASGIWLLMYKDSAKPLFSLNAEDLQALKAVSSAALSISDKLNRPILESVHIKTAANTLQIEATDGYRMHIMQRAGSYPVFDAALSTSALKTLGKCVKSLATVNLFHGNENSTNVMISGARGNVVFFDTYPKGFPNTDKIKHDSETITVNSRNLFTQLKHIKAAVGLKNGAVVTEYSKDSVLLKSDLVLSYSYAQNPNVSVPVDVTGTATIERAVYRLTQFIDMVECFDADMQLSFVDAGSCRGRVEATAVDGKYAKRVVLMPLNR